MEREFKKPRESALGSEHPMELHGSESYIDGRLHTIRTYESTYKSGNPESAKAHTELGHILSKLGMHNDAEMHFRGAVDNYNWFPYHYLPEKKEAHQNLVDCLLRQGKSEEAEMHRKRVLELLKDLGSTQGVKRDRGSKECVGSGYLGPKGKRGRRFGSDPDDGTGAVDMEI